MSSRKSSAPPATAPVENPTDAIVEVVAAVSPAAPELAAEPDVAPAVADGKSKKDKEEPKETVKKEKTKLIRDGYTMPETDYQRFAELKQRALAAGMEIKKSELLRAGLHALAALPEADFLQALSQLEKLKTGRPGK